MVIIFMVDRSKLIYVDCIRAVNVDHKIMIYVHRVLLDKANVYLFNQIDYIHNHKTPSINFFWFDHYIMIQSLKLSEV